jgi:hypothetical protein
MTLFVALILVFWVSVCVDWENIWDGFWIDNDDTTGC